MRAVSEQQHQRCKHQYHGGQIAALSRIVSRIEVLALAARGDSACENIAARFMAGRCCA